MWVNRARANPMSMVQELKELLACFQGKTYRDPETLVSVQTNEVAMGEQGRDAVFEAIATLKTQAPLPPLKLSRGLTQAARDHCYDIGPQGGASHVGSDGSTMTDRIEKYGRWHRAISENISFSETSGRSIVLQFLVDDGNESRSHRKNLFNPEYSLLTSYAFVGVGCGFHKNFELICVIDLAGTYEDFFEQLLQAKNSALASRRDKENRDANPARASFYESPKKPLAEKLPRTPRSPGKNGPGARAQESPATWGKSAAWTKDQPSPNPPGRKYQGAGSPYEAGNAQMKQSRAWTDELGTPSIFGQTLEDFDVEDW